MDSYFIEKTIGSKVDSAGKAIGITEDADVEMEREKKESKKREEKKRKYLEERRVKRHEENKARNDRIRNKYAFAEKEEKKSSSISLFKKEPKKAPLQSKKSTPICIVEGCDRTASVVQPVCPLCDQPVCYNHRLETDHPCSTVAAVKGAAGAVFDSMVGYVESAKSEFGEGRPKNERGGSNEKEEAIVQRGLGTAPGGKGEKDEEGDEFSWDYISRRLEETKESLTDSVQSSLREFNLAGEHELTEEEKRYWGGIEESEKKTPPHHLRKEEEKEKTVGEVVDEVASTISSWFNGEGESSGSSAGQPKESEGSSFFSSWF